MAKSVNKTGDVETPYLIRQDFTEDGRLDNDCGPTCTIFLRYGGQMAAYQPPQEGQEAVTHEGVREMCCMIRQQVLHQSKEEAAVSDRTLTTGHDQLSRAISEFAPVHAGLIYQGKKATKWISNTVENGSREKSEAEILAEIVGWFNTLQEHDPRGIIIPILYNRNMTAREAREAGVKWKELEEAKAMEEGREPKKWVAAVPHVVVYLAPEGNTAAIFDPAGNPNHDFQLDWNLMEFAYAHYWYCTAVQKQEEATPWRVAPPAGKTIDQGFTSYVIHGAKVPGSPDETQETRTKGSPYILAGDTLGEIDMKSMWSTAFGEDLIAQENATYYFSYKTADVAAEALSETTSVAVIECPEGLFAVVPVNDLGSDLTTGDSEVDLSDTGSSEDSFFQNNWTTGMASLWLHLAYEEDGERQIHRTKAALIMGNSHRENY
jgi:hypothetical protein